MKTNGKRPQGHARGSLGAKSLTLRPAAGSRLAWAAINALEVLESRTLLTTSFASLPYADPFPAPAQRGEPAQGSGAVLYTESFADQSPTGGVLGTTDRYWAQGTTLNRALPASMQNGLAQMSVEFWMKLPSGSMSNGDVIKMPGFEVGGNSNWALTPSGAVLMKFSTMRAGEPLQTLSTWLGANADGQWHQYAATFDGQGASFYLDGQLTDQDWVSNSADKVGPQIFSGSTATTPTAISYLPFGGTSQYDEVRVSNVALTAGQVRKNFENYRQYSNTYYVSPAGVAGNTGTRQSPWDLASGLTRVGADIKLVLLAGTYNGNLFHVTRSGNSPLHAAVITGDEGAAQAIVQVSGATQGALVDTSAKYVTLRNLTFVADQSPALTFSGAARGNLVDGCRITSNVDAMSVLNTAGYQDQMSWDGFHQLIVPGVTLQNSVLAAGTSGAGVRYTNSPIIVARNNTFVGGQYGAYFTGSVNTTLLNNVFSGQTGAGVYFNSDSLQEVSNYWGADHTFVSYAGDGNVYNPASGGSVATVVTATGTNNYATLSDYARYWYELQYGTDIIKGWGDSGAGIGNRSEGRSVQGVPTFTASGDFRLLRTSPNLIDTGVERVFGRPRAGVSLPTWDGQGNVRAQGNAVDAGGVRDVRRDLCQLHARHGGHDQRRSLRQFGQTGAHAVERGEIPGRNGDGLLERPERQERPDGRRHLHDQAAGQQRSVHLGWCHKQLQPDRRP